MKCRYRSLESDSSLRCCGFIRPHVSSRRIGRGQRTFRRHERTGWLASSTVLFNRPLGPGWHWRMNDRRAAQTVSSGADITGRDRCKVVFGIALSSRSTGSIPRFLQVFRGPSRQHKSLRLPLSIMRQLPTNLPSLPSLHPAPLPPAPPATPSPCLIPPRQHTSPSAASQARSGPWSSKNSAD